MNHLFTILCLLSLQGYFQNADTLNGYANKISGEEITYFSPLRQFAKTALLTRVNGNMPISWEAPVYKGKDLSVTYEMLIGHSTGTSTGDRKFDVSLNGTKLFVIKTLMKQKGNYELTSYPEKNTGYTFIQQEYDVNGDAFGKLFITVPASLVNIKASFTISGQNENSRDWLMVFMYRKGVKIIAEPTSLITRKENKRQLNLFIDNPYPDNTTVEIKSNSFDTKRTLHNGYNKLSIAAYDKNKTGFDSLQFIINKKDTAYKTVELKPVKNYVFHIIHHSHNDIGYSHLQTEVEKIQNKNIADAVNWIRNTKLTQEKPIWHIESLWAVENYLKTASPEDINNFVDAVNGGQLVLSANYANILTGLCQDEELNWVFDYAKQLEKQYGFTISNGMITDIPGITWSGLLSYVNNGIPYLSLGPNYVENQADKGDRIGGVIKEQGDKIFYWKPDLQSDKKVLVWTAGKGYSLFHNITDKEKQQSWEQRISQYCDELQGSNYPYDIVQLRYTKNSDNGPVDTMLCSFIDNWNKQYQSPQLKISSVDKLFKEFEAKYKSVIPVATGEISPYWEDGAFSTAIEEMDNRELAIKSIALEKYARNENKYQANEQLFYALHKNIILFHEHTWGSWFSISDPEIPFTTEQWNIKKQFLDSGKYYYSQLASLLGFQYQKPILNTEAKNRINDFTIDTIHGGLKTILVNGKNVVAGSGYYFFEPVYELGINPMHENRAKFISAVETENSESKKVVSVNTTLPSIQNITIVYTLFKKQGRLSCHYSFDKTIEKEKESFHIALPFDFTNPEIRYGTGSHMIAYNKDQLPGSNKEFVCVPEKLTVQSNELKATILCPRINLFEIGTIIDENKTNGAKIWKTKNNNTSTLFVYVFNNYWHTNFKAWQEGRFDFEMELGFE